MKSSDLAELALRNLREAKLRNGLTTLGIAVGVASLVAMLSLGVGLQQLASRKLSNSGLFDTVFVSPKFNIRGFGGPNASLAPDSRPLDEDARRELEKIPNVVEVYPNIRFFTEVRFEGKPHMTVVAGVPQSSRGNGSYDAVQGAFFSSASAEQVILQIEFAKELSESPASLIGKDIVMRYAERQTLPAQQGTSSASDASGGGFSIIPREKSLRIVGIVETDPAGGSGGFGSGRVLMPLSVAEMLRPTSPNDLRDALRSGATPGKPTYANLTVRAARPAQVEAIEASIKKMGFSAFSLLDASRNIRLFFTIFDLLLGIFGSLALAVATLGIINTLVMAILERRREIGVLKALGAADRDVKQIFFAEAGVMGLFGGIFGVGFGWFIGRALTWGTNLYLQRQNLPTTNVFAVPWWLVLGAIIFAVMVSLAAGLYPASRAAKLDPVEALRYE